MLGSLDPAALRVSGAGARTGGNSRGWSGNSKITLSNNSTVTLSKIGTVNTSARAQQSGVSFRPYRQGEADYRLYAQNTQNHVESMARKYNIKQEKITPGPGYCQNENCPYMPWEIGYKVYKKKGRSFDKQKNVDIDFVRRSKIPGPNYKPKDHIPGKTISPRHVYRGEIFPYD